jgi:hypothetical protein
MTDYSLGLCLGGRQGRSALAVLESAVSFDEGAGRWERRYAVVHLQRWQGVRYADLVSEVGGLLARAPGGHRLAGRRWPGPRWR